MSDAPYELRLAPASARQLKKLDAQTRDRTLQALRAQGSRAAAARSGRRGGKRVKALRGRTDRFFRLRVGEYRVMYDVIDEERTLLVLGVVHRRDLERWLRGR
ncbi:MAG TPA: type II toxin-antitoxin system RelE/ParE family toxin [Solirubrobacteraceae bacterium]|nr:type II toxin-antitoxin system RelE/ParE family toxin [Solirubrobacteraceae bacterium]